MASPFKKIRGKQITNNEITAAHLFVTGSSATQGQVPAYDSGSGGFIWTTLSADTIQSVSGNTALTVNNPFGTDVVLSVNLDGQTIYTNGSNQLHLGDPNNNNLITGSLFGFSNDVIIYGNLTVNGTATTVNSETVTIADNFIELNSNFTAGTPTQNAGIEVRRGDETNVIFRWNETNDWWEVTNPEGTGNTYSAILTTSSVENGPEGSPDGTVVVTVGTGGNADKIYLSVDESNFANIPNSALTNSSITVNAGTGLGGGGTVALGGSVTLSATPVADYYVTGGSTSYGVTNVGTLVLNRQNGNVVISIEDTFVTGGTLSGSNLILSRNDGQTVTVDLSALDVNDTYSTGGTLTTTPTSNSQLGQITITGNDGFTPYVIDSVNNTWTTGATVNNGTGVITFYRNDGGTYNADLSGFDFNDTYSTGGTVTSNASNNSNSQVFQITGNGGFTPYNVNGLTDTFVTGGTLNGSNLILTKNDGNQVTVDIGAATADSYVTGGTTTGSSDASPNATIDLTYNQGVLPGTYTLDYEDTYVTGGTVASGTLTLDRNDSTQVTVSGTIIQSVTGQNGITASTSNGDVTIGLTNNSHPVPTLLNKGMSIASAFTGSTGDDQNTGIVISGTPAFDSYIGVSVNGVWYEVQDGTGTTKDCYFMSATDYTNFGGCTNGFEQPIADVVTGSHLCWNGTTSGFNLDQFDRVDFYYNI